jgi:hypothetical protein
MADTVGVRCAACALDIALRDGQYHLARLCYHPECYDRKQALLLGRIGQRGQRRRAHSAPGYGSAPAEGPVKGTHFAADWPRVLATYYGTMGWDAASGKPLPETLRAVQHDELSPLFWSSTDTQHVIPTDASG